MLPKQKPQTRRMPPRTSSGALLHLELLTELTNDCCPSWQDNIPSVTCLHNYSSHLARFLNVQLLAGGEEDAEADEEDEHRRLQAQLCNQNQSLISCWCKSSYADQNPDLCTLSTSPILYSPRLYSPSCFCWQPSVCTVLIKGTWRYVERPI